MAEYWVTKYWETKGLFKIAGRLVEGNKYVSETHENGSEKSYGLFLRLGRDAFAEKADAARRAEELLAKRIVSLKKKLKKLENMSFEEE